MALDLQKDNNHLMIFKKQIISLTKSCIGWKIYNLQSKLLAAGVLRSCELRFLPQNHLKFEWRTQQDWFAYGEKCLINWPHFYLVRGVVI